MSVINRMLLQLDERRAATPEAAGTGAAGAVKAVPPTASGRLGWIVLGGAALVSATAFGHWSDVPGLLHTPTRAPQPVVITPAAAAPVVLTSVPTSAPAAAVPLATAAPALRLAALPPRIANRTTDRTTDRTAEHTVAHNAERHPAVTAVRTPSSNTVVTAAIAVSASPDKSRTVAMAAPSLPTSYLPQPDSGSVEKRVIPPSAAQRATLAYQQAIDLAASGHSNPAIAQALDALKADPDHIAARELAAALMMENHRLADAAELMREGLARQPQQPHLIMLLARIEAETGDTRAALDRLTAAPGLDGEGHGLRAALLARAERYREAANAYEAAVRLQPDNATWWFGLGVSLDANGQAALARQALQRARAIGSLRGDALAYLDQKLAN